MEILTPGMHCQNHDNKGSDLEFQSWNLIIIIIRAFAPSEAPFEKLYKPTVPKEALYSLMHFVALHEKC